MARWVVGSGRAALDRSRVKAMQKAEGSDEKEDHTSVEINAERYVEAAAGHEECGNSERAGPGRDHEKVNDALGDLADAHFGASHMVERTCTKRLLQGEDSGSVNPRCVFTIGREGGRGAFPPDRRTMTEAPR